MKKLSLFFTAILIVLLQNSCQIRHANGWANIPEYCYWNVFNDYRNLSWLFRGVIRGELLYHSSLFEQVSDSTWKPVPSECDSREFSMFVKSAIITLTEDSTVTVTFDGHNFEENDDCFYDAHIFTLEEGIVNNKGVIRVEFLKNDAPWGWAEIILDGDFWADDEIDFISSLKYDKLSDFIFVGEYLGGD